MQTQEETFEVRGSTIVVRELLAAEIGPLYALLSGEENDDNTDFQFAMIEACVRIDGEPVEDAKTLPGSVYLKLLPKVLDLNGVSVEDEDAGNG